jgi:hypothetical protein
MNGGYVLDGMNNMLAVIRIKQHVVINETIGRTAALLAGARIVTNGSSIAKIFEFAPESQCEMKCNV